MQIAKTTGPKALMVLKMKSCPTVLHNEKTTRWMCIAGCDTTKSTALSNSCVCTRVIREKTMLKVLTMNII